MTRVWDLELPDSEKIVLLALADCANDEGHCWPGLTSLGKKTSKSRRTIQICIQRLVDAGHLTRREVVGKGCNYTVHPRSDCTGAETAPPQRLPGRGAETAPKPSMNRKTSGAKAPSVSRETSIDDQPESFRRDSVHWARTTMEWAHGQAETEFDRFADSAAAHGRKYRDWRAAWRSWCRSPFCKTKSATEATAYRSEPIHV